MCSEQAPAYLITQLKKKVPSDELAKIVYGNSPTAKVKRLIQNSLKEHCDNNIASKVLFSLRRELEPTKDSKFYKRQLRFRNLEKTSQTEGPFELDSRGSLCGSSHHCYECIEFMKGDCDEGLIKVGRLLVPKSE